MSKEEIEANKIINEKYHEFCETVDFSNNIQIDQKIFEIEAEDEKTDEEERKRIIERKKSKLIFIINS